jgi:hypothetical protein
MGRLAARCAVTLVMGGVCGVHGDHSGRVCHPRPWGDYPIKGA